MSGEVVGEIGGKLHRFIVCCIASRVSEFHLLSTAFEVSGHGLTEAVKDAREEADIPIGQIAGRTTGEGNHVIQEIFADDRRDDILLDSTEVWKHSDKLLA